MMKYAERVTEIHRSIGNGHGVNSRKVEGAVGKMRKIVCRHGYCRRWINTMQMADSRRSQERPAPGTATCVEAHRVTANRLPGEQREISLEQIGTLVMRQLRLIEPFPFAPEVRNNFAVDIRRAIRIHVWRTASVQTAL